MPNNFKKTLTKNWRGIFAKQNPEPFKTTKELKLELEGNFATQNPESFKTTKELKLELEGNFATQNPESLERMEAALPQNMYKVFTDIDSELISRYEDYFCEIEIFNWSIEQMVDNPEDVTLCGYFDSEEEARSAYEELRGVFSELSADYTVEQVFEEDFQNAYKKYLSAFSYKDLHWVPIWLKDEYTENKEEDKVFYFDAQMAFGTGDHPTTRLCMMRILDFEAKYGLADKSLADAGCGSGILAMTAMLYGCKKLRAFDIDEAAIKVCLENAGFNGLNVDGVFMTSNIAEGLGGVKYDLVVANIQSDILMLHAKYLLEAVADNGVLILSGILKEENEKVREFFTKASPKPIKSIDFKEMGDWSDVMVEF